MKADTCAAFVLAAALLLPACSGKAPDPYTDDKPTSGRVVLIADEGMRPLLERQELVFEGFYAKADVDIRYMNAAELMRALMDDTVRCAFGSVLPGGEQESWLKERQRVARIIPLCTDAVVVLANKQRALRAMDLPTLRSLLRAGNSWPIWAALDGVSQERVSLVFDGAGSGVMRTLADSLFAGEPVTFNGRTEPDVAAVVARVASDPNSLGLVPFASISDLDDPAMRALRDQVDQVALSPTADLATAVKPSQGTLADGRYPLRRKLYAVLTEPKSGLGTGFVSFVAGHKGQRIILKQGLAPQRVPARDVEIVQQ
jgi:phosphate transport system substrate-binding protein